MKKLILSFALTLSIVAGGAGAHLASGGTTVTTAHAADSMVGYPMPSGGFRCFLCTWYGCAITNVGGSGCNESTDWCTVQDWGCSDWPSGGFIGIRW